MVNTLKEKVGDADDCRENNKKSTLQIATNNLQSALSPNIAIRFVVKLL